MRPGRTYTIQKTACVLVQILAEYGLLVKTYNTNTLSPAREVPSSVAALFLEAKRQGAHMDMELMPTSSLWRFNVGEPVLSTETEIWNNGFLL